LTFLCNYALSLFFSQIGTNCGKKPSNLKFLISIKLILLIFSYYFLLPLRRRLFDDMKALTTYLCFDSWEHLIDFMIEGWSQQEKNLLAAPLISVLDSFFLIMRIAGQQPLIWIYL